MDNHGYTYQFSVCITMGKCNFFTDTYALTVRVLYRLMYITTLEDHHIDVYNGNFLLASTLCSETSPWSYIPDSGM